METLLIVVFAVGAVPFAAGVVYCGINFRPGREFPSRRWPIVVMVIGFLLAAAAVLTGIATSGSSVFSGTSSGDLVSTAWPRSITFGFACTSTWG